MATSRSTVAASASLPPGDLAQRPAPQSSSDPFAEAASRDANGPSSTSPTDTDGAAGGRESTHDPILHAHLLQSRYRGPARTIRAKWRHVVLNLRSGEIKIYTVESVDMSKNKHNPNAVNSKNRTKSEVYFVPRHEDSGRSKAAALVSTLPDEADLELRLPKGSWLMRDMVGNDMGFLIKYDLRSFVSNSHRRRQQLRNLMEKPLNAAGIPLQEAKVPPRAINFQIPEKEAKRYEEDDAADDSFAGEDGAVHAPDDDDTIASAMTDITAGLPKLKLKGNITFRCPGGGNEKAMWQKAASRCGGIIHVAEDDADDATGLSNGRFPTPPTVSSAGRSAMKYISKSTPVSHVSKAVPKAVKPKNITWRYRRDFTAVGALNMSVMIRGPLPNSAIDELHRSINQDDEDVSQDSAHDMDSSGRIKEYKVQPEWAYPNVWMTPQELKREVLRPSDHWHDLRDDVISTSNAESRAGGPDGKARPRQIGSLHVEVLGCHGLAREETVASAINLSDGSGGAVVYLVAGSNAFCTDIIPGIRDHFWLRKTKRAVVFPIYHPYARLYAGVFDADTNDFAGRAMVDVAQLRPNSSYTVTLPLRQTAQVYIRRGRGTILLRFSLEWEDEKAAVLSYLPPTLSAKPVAVPCGDKVALRNVARTVHGEDMHGKWSRPIMKATTKELKLYKMHTKALMRQTMKDISGWVKPTFSLYLFWSWMHCVYRASMALVLPYFFGFAILLLARTYAINVVGSSRHMGYAPVTMMELLYALFSRKGSKNRIRPLAVEKSTQQHGPPMPQHPLAKICLFLGLVDEEEVLEGNGYHMEFPFSDGERHRKLTIAESYAKHAPEKEETQRLPSKGVITEEELMRFDDDDSHHDSSVSVGGLENSSTRSVSSQASFDCDAALVPFITHITPDQNMDVPYKGTTIFEDLEEFRGIAHSCTLGLVNDRVVKAQRLVLRSSVPEAGICQSDYFQSSNDLDFGVSDGDESLLGAMEKSLGIGVQYNPVLVMQQKFCGPMVQIQRVGLIAFRSVFNLLMWSDPFASSWLVMILMGLVVVTALFPWRLVFFVGGLGFVGPQNWLLRLYKERNPPRIEESSALIVDEIKKSTKSSKLTPTNIHLPTLAKKSVDGVIYDIVKKPFVSHANRSKSNGTIKKFLWSNKKGESALAEVLVPYSPLRQDRFYDWPPEPMHSRCKNLDPSVEPVHCGPREDESVGVDCRSVGTSTGKSSPPRTKKIKNPLGRTSKRK